MENVKILCDTDVIIEYLKVLSAFNLFLMTEEITEIAIKLIERYSKSHGLKIPDALIASTAIYYDIKLWTYNVKDFRFIKELKLMNTDEYLKN